MNRYPLWKNLLVFGVVIVSTIIALPNVFGDDEAVQLSRSDGVAVDEPTLEQLRTKLMDSQLPYLSAELEGTGAVVRVETPELQQQAQAALSDAFPSPYVVALTLSPRTPGWLRALGLGPMLLGLDLRGGVHFLYEVDLDTAISQYLETYETDLRAQFRPRNIRNDVRVVGTEMHVAILEPSDLDAAEQIIRQLDTGDQLVQLGQVSGRLDIQRGTVDGRQGFIVRLTPSAIRERQDFAIQQNTVTLRNRVNALGVAEAVVQRQGLDRILV
ncbi:MAG TPA: protein translocase subunit SecD, partial [Gammaproteobacteria bacterium]|nr:protein translocase subunit SecD [Gammaproteobacteria bacterium]